MSDEKKASNGAAGKTEQSATESKDDERESESGPCGLPKKCTIL